MDPMRLVRLHKSIFQKLCAPQIDKANGVLATIRPCLQKDLPEICIQVYRDQIAENEKLLKGYTAQLAILEEQKFTLDGLDIPSAARPVRFHLTAFPQAFLIRMSQ